MTDIKSDNPFCENCLEPDCLVSFDGTCAMIRRYLDIAKPVPDVSKIPSVEEQKKLNEQLNKKINQEWNQ